MSKGTIHRRHAGAILVAGMVVTSLMLGAPVSATVEAIRDVRGTTEAVADLDAGEPASEVPTPGLRAGDVVVAGRPTRGGFVVLAARGGGALAPVANLVIGGIDSYLWTGGTCVTGSGRRAAAWFAPAEHTNDADRSARGAFLAVIDLADGQVELVNETVALGRGVIGCGPDDEIAAVRRPVDGDPDTEGFRVADDATIVDRFSVPGSFHSPTPVGGRTFLAGAEAVIDVAAPTVPVEVVSDGSLVALAPAGREGLRLVVGRGDGDVVRDVAIAGSLGSTDVATGRPGGAVELLSGTGGASVVVGDLAEASTSVPTVGVAEVPDAVSLDGELTVRLADPPAAASSPVDDQVEVTVHSQASPPEPAVALDLSAAQSVAPVATAAAPTSPCAIPRNDPDVQVVQPSPAQVVWAVRRAVRGQLTSPRPPNWQRNGLGAYSPQGEFPPSLGGGVRVPAEVLLGVLAQESNLWQAARGALPGVPGNPLIGNYYGLVYDAQGLVSGTDPSRADCGYGVGQITDGMTASSTAFTASQKKMIATDYQVNVAVALRFLQQKWADTQALGLRVGAGDPSKIESWYFAVWAYNSGSYPRTSSSAPYGVGWQNNPANSDWSFSRRPFLRASAGDARHPGDWSYPERVMGFAENGLPLNDGYGFSGVGPLDLPVDAAGRVSRFIMCDTRNECSPTHSSPGATPTQGDASFCTRTDRKCYWHHPVTFPGPGTSEDPTSPSVAEPAVDNPYPPACTASAASFPQPGPTSVPASAAIVDDVDTMARNVVGCSARASAGTFGFTSGSGSLGVVDTAQIGAGYGGHMWYSHTVSPSRPANVMVGTWTAPGVSGWRRIQVHIPEVGAETTQARYEIDHDADPSTPARFRVVNQRWNRNTWVDLGVFDLRAGFTVRLSNATLDDHQLTTQDPLTGASRRIEVSVAWDAVAFTSATKPSVAMVALGDSFSSGEGVEPYHPNSDVGRTTPGQVDDCHRSPQAYPALVFGQLATAGTTTFAHLACSGAETIHLMDDAKSHEPPQLAQGWLDENTTLVTLGIGGNDARFGDILKGCILTATPCSSSSYRLTTGEGVDPEPLVAYEPKVIGRLSNAISETLTAIGLQAPNARIIVVGYPHVVAAANDNTGAGACGALRTSDLELFDAWTDQLNGVLSREAEAAGAYFEDLQPRYEGHEACARQTEWINALVAESDSGSGVDRPGRGSFHPKAAGHAAAAPDIVALARAARPAGPRPFATLGAAIAQQYRDFLAREPSSSEVAVWTAAITAGSSSIDDLIDQLAHDPRWAQHRAVVTRLYWAFFLRMPDTSGLDHWTGRLAAGSSIDAVAQAFASSPEFVQRYGTLADGAFVAQIYRNIFERAPDSSGLAYWTAELSSRRRSRGAVVAAFAESSEGRTRLRPQVDTALVWRGMVRSLPGAAAGRHWISTLTQGTQLTAMVRGLRLSSTYQERVT